MATSPSSRTRLLYPSDQSDQNDRESTLFCLDNYEALNNNKKHSTLINKRYIHNKNAGNTYDDVDVGGKESSSIFLSLVYGLINAVLTVPCMYGYCAIIFSDEVYLPYRNDLSKLVLLSSAIHQLVFTLL